MLWRKALFVLSQFSRVMEEKMEEPLLQVQGQVNGRIAIDIASSYLRMIRGDRLPIPLRERETDWGPELGIGLVG